MKIYKDIDDFLENSENSEDEEAFTKEYWIESCEYGIRKLTSNGGIRNCINTEDVSLYLTLKDKGELEAELKDIK